MTRTLTPSVARLSGTVERAAQSLNGLPCTRVHVDAVVGGRLPKLPVLEDFPADMRALFKAAVDFHIFDLRDSPRPLRLPLREKDCVILHVFPWTSPANVHAVLRSVGDGSAVGLALDVDAPLQAVLGHVDAINAILVMGGPVGAVREPLDGRALSRLRQLRRVVRTCRGAIRLGIDGGVNRTTLLELADLADFIVVGSLLFDAPDTAAQWAELNSLVEKACLP
jgi:pentose-5-phosphate-3-epimerase